MNEARLDPAFDPSRCRQPLNRWIVGETQKTAAAVTGGARGLPLQRRGAGPLPLPLGHVLRLVRRAGQAPAARRGRRRPQAETRATAAWVLAQALHLLHPIAPFVTEELWQQLFGRPGGLLIRRAGRGSTASWSTPRPRPSSAGWCASIGAIRAARTELNVPPGARLTLHQQGAAPRPLARLERHRRRHPAAGPARRDRARASGRRPPQSLSGRGRRGHVRAAGRRRASISPPSRRGWRRRSASSTAEIDRGRAEARQCRLRGARAGRGGRAAARAAGRERRPRASGCSRPCTASADRAALERTSTCCPASPPPAAAGPAACRSSPDGGSPAGSRRRRRARELAGGHRLQGQAGCRGAAARAGGEPRRRSLVVRAIPPEPWDAAALFAALPPATGGWTIRRAAAAGPRGAGLGARRLSLHPLSPRRGRAAAARRCRTVAGVQRALHDRRGDLARARPDQHAGQRPRARPSWPRRWPRWPAASAPSCRIIVGDDAARRQLSRRSTPSAAPASRAPRLVDLRWGDPAAPKVTLVGKGVCFDTGGLDIKPSSNMLLMKKDMGGAARDAGAGPAASWRWTCRSACAC